MSFRNVLGTATALVAWVCVLVQLVYSVRNGLARGESVPRALANYFAYFTILTNLLVALVLTLPALAPGRRVGRAFADLRVTWTAAAAILVGARRSRTLACTIWCRPCTPRGGW